jgi:hypothetical protein
MFGQNCSRPSWQFGTGVIGINQAADADGIARLEPGHRGSNFHDTTDDLVARHTWIYRGQEIVPFVASVVEVGVADTTEENLDLHVVLGSIATRNGSETQARSRAGSGVGFGLVHEC